MTFTKRYFYILFFALIIFITLYLRLDLYFDLAGIHSDEAKLALNMLQNGFFDMFKPLDNLQVAPPVFLILSKIIYSLTKIHQGYYTTDLLLRFLPLLSGIISIPLFGYLIYKLFRNRIITLTGMFLLAINLVHTLYSTVFKQYSFETLILICIMILFLKIDFKNKTLKYNLIIFLLLGLSLFCSMTSVFVIPGGFLYLLFKIKNKEILKNFSICTCVFSMIFLAYLAFFIFPVINTNYNGLQEYWTDKYTIPANFYSYIVTFVKECFRTQQDKWINFCSITFILGVITIIFKNIKLGILTLSPIIIMSVFTINGIYPLEERLIIFAIPSFIIGLLFVFKVIPIKIYSKYFLIFYILIGCFAITILRHLPEKNYIHAKIHNSRNAWMYFSNLYKENPGKIIVAKSVPSTKYYMIVSNKNYSYIPYNEVKELKKGTYYIISSTYTEETQKEVTKIIGNGKIIKTKTFKTKATYDDKTPVPSIVIKFEL